MCVQSIGIKIQITTHALFTLSLNRAAPDWLICRIAVIWWDWMDK